MTRFTLRLLPAVLAALLAACTNVPVNQGMHGDSQRPISSGDRPLSDLAPSSPAEARAQVHVELGLAYLQVGRHDVALDEANIALQDIPGYAPAYHLIGLVYMALSDDAKANDYLLRALRTAPGDPEFNNTYGWFLCSTGRENEGLQRLAAASRNPYYRQVSRPYTNAGLCYLRLGNDVAAEGQFRRALEADAANAQALFHLAAIAYRRADFVGARGYLVRLHQQSEPTPETVWLGLRTERRLGNRDSEASYAAQLRMRFAESPEYQQMLRGNFE
jgi:type IV pilus assembly protein PilF